MVVDALKLLQPNPFGDAIRRQHGVDVRVSPQNFVDRAIGRPRRSRIGDAVVGAEWQMAYRPRCRPCVSAVRLRSVFGRSASAQPQGKKTGEIAEQTCNQQTKMARIGLEPRAQLCQHVREAHDPNLHRHDSQGGACRRYTSDELMHFTASRATHSCQSRRSPH